MTEIEATPRPQWTFETVPTSIGVCHNIDMKYEGRFHNACIYDDCGVGGKPSPRPLEAAQIIITAVNAWDSPSSLRARIRELESNND